MMVTTIRKQWRIVGKGGNYKNESRQRRGSLYIVVSIHADTDLKQKRGGKGQIEYKELEDIIVDVDKQ